MLHIEFCLYFVLLFGYISVCTETEEKPGGPYVYNDTRPSQMGLKPRWDPNGYVFFCLCMGKYYCNKTVRCVKVWATAYYCAVCIATLLPALCDLLSVPRR